MNLPIAGGAFKFLCGNESAQGYLIGILASPGKLEPNRLLIFSIVEQFPRNIEPLRLGCRSNVQLSHSRVVDPDCQLVSCRVELFLGKVLGQGHGRRAGCLVGRPAVARSMSQEPLDLRFGIRRSRMDRLQPQCVKRPEFGC